MFKESAVYVPTKYSFGGLKNAVIARRSAKEIGHEIDLRGRKSSQFEIVMQDALAVLDSMQEVHKDWINHKIEQITPYFRASEGDIDNGEMAQSPDPDDRISSAFQNGLVTAITQEYKVDKASDRINSPHGLDTVITGYAFDFYRTLRVCQNSGVNPNTALRIAQLAYHHNPDVLIKLSTDDRYKDLNPSVITSAALSYPKNPEAFLDGFIAKIAELSTDDRYKDLNPSVIERAALYYPKNPEAFLDGFIKKGLVEHLEYWDKLAADNLI